MAKIHDNTIQSGNLQMPAVQLHDYLLHFVLVRQQAVCLQEVPVSDIIIVADLRCHLDKSRTSAEQHQSKHLQKACIQIHTVHISIFTEVLRYIAVQLPQFC